MNIRLLLVDDHEDARTALARRLQRDPRLELVGTVSSVEEAAGLLPRACPDIVLLDIHQHDGGGVDVCRALHELTDAPVVILASFMTPELWGTVQRVGAADYLLKHIDTDRLSREIIRLAERYRPGQSREHPEPPHVVPPPPVTM
jgi:DNA-binding NarL/FixJ family response regulator